MKKSKLFTLALLLCSFICGAGMNIIFIGDPHTFGDADKPGRELKDEKLRKMRLNGGYVNMFVDKLMKNPDYLPVGEEAKLMDGFSLASAIAHILRSEDPDLVVVGGDYHPTGMPNLWPGLGLKDLKSATDDDLIEYQEIFDEHVRNIFSRIPCEVVFVRGNHDVPPSLTGPGIKRKNPAGQWTKCIEIDAGGFSVMVMVLDSESGNRNPVDLVEDFTIGDWQKRMIEDALERNKNTDHKIFVQHKMFGGWPGGVSGNYHGKPKAIGQAATPEDYRKLQEDTGVSFSIPNIDQCWLTKKMVEAGVDLSLYAHNHIFHHRKIRDLNLTCMGSTKFSGEKSYWESKLWKKYFGSWEDQDFFGCGGVTKVTIKKKEIVVEYIRTSTVNRSNVPDGIPVGGVISRFSVEK